MPLFYKFLCFIWFSLVLAGSLGAAAQGFQGTSSPGFTQNQGQLTNTDGEACDEVLFYSEINGQRVYFRKTGISYVFTKTEEIAGTAEDGLQRPAFPSLPEDLPERQIQYHRLDVEFAGRNPVPDVEGINKKTTRYNYYYGHCPDGILNVHSFEEIIYKEVYPNINIRFYYTETEDGPKLKYDIIVHPGGDVSSIQFNYNGATEIYLDNGNLIITTPLGTITELAPKSYQKEKEIESKFILDKKNLAFEVDKYNPEEELVIDPYVTPWASYLGGSAHDQLSFNVVTDSANNVYLSGFTFSLNFPTTPGAFQTSPGPGNYEDGFITKFDSTGNMVWATYYGGNFRTSLTVTLYKENTLYACGYTSATNFPVTSGAFQAATGGDQDGVLLKFDTSGTRVWATYYGGSGNDVFHHLSVDDSANIYVTGETSSLNFPVTLGAYQSSNNIGVTKAVLVKIDSTGSPLWSTYFGGATGMGIKRTEGSATLVNPSGNVMLGGVTTTNTLPVTDTSTHSGGVDYFIAQFDSGGSLLYSTYFGDCGTTKQPVIDMAYDEAGNYYLALATSKGNLPITGNSFMTNIGNASQRTCYFAKVSPTHVLQWSTYYGGTQFYDDAYSVSVGNNKVVIGGITQSVDFPATPFSGSSNLNERNAFTAIFDYAGNRLVSYVYGGSGEDELMTLDYNRYTNSIVTAGYTNSTDFPVTPGAYQATSAGGYDIFLSRHCERPAPITADTITWYCPNDSILLTGDSSFQAFLWSTGDTTPQIYVHEGGLYWVVGYDTSGCFGFDSVVVNMLTDSFDL